SKRTSIFFFQAEDGIRDLIVTGVQTCALPISDVHHLPPLLRTDARFRRAGRVPVRGGDADLCRALAAAVVRAHLAVHQQLRDGDRRITAVLVLVAERLGGARGSGEHRVKPVSLRGYAVGRNFRLPGGTTRTRGPVVTHPR